MGQFEEYKFVSQPVAWVLVILICISILAWGFFTYVIVPDTPRQWNYPYLPDVPGQSEFSTQRVPATLPGDTQLQPLPEARPIHPGGGR